MRIDAGSLNFLAGPAIAVIALALVVLFLRWAFGSSPATRERRRRPPAELLVPVATVRRPETAQALRAVLTDAGIRSTTRSTAPLRTDVLVFREDAERARALTLTFGAD